MQLRRPRDVAGPEVGDGERVDLLVAAAAGGVDDRLAVFRELEFRHAFARVGDALRFAAVETHDEELVARHRRPRRRVHRRRPGCRQRRGAGRVAIGEERDEAPSCDHLRARLVLVFRERQLPRARQRRDRSTTI